MHQTLGKIIIQNGSRSRHIFFSDYGQAIRIEINNRDLFGSGSRSFILRVIIGD